MKELTYEDWQKNPTPRMMWVWNEDEMHKVKRSIYKSSNRRTKKFSA